VVPLLAFWEGRGFVVIAGVGWPSTSPEVGGGEDEAGVLAWSFFFFLPFVCTGPSVVFGDGAAVVGANLFLPDWACIRALLFPMPFAFGLGSTTA
jgi:hypothetical protein